jgi:N-acyl-D-aspartate/D-glutamate deacylase
MLTRQLTLSLIIVALTIGCSESQPFDYDLVIRGGTVFDGSGEPGVVGDVGIRGDRIVAVGDINGKSAHTIDASDLYVTPGFIDMHSHSETFRLLNGGQGPSFGFSCSVVETKNSTSNCSTVMKT